MKKADDYILYTFCRTSWVGDQPVARLLPAYRTAQTQTFMLQVRFEATNPAFEQAKTVHALDRAATMLGSLRICWLEIHKTDDRTVSQLLV
jgi:hypothetical protein